MSQFSCQKSWNLCKIWINEQDDIINEQELSKHKNILYNIINLGAYIGTVFPWTCGIPIIRYNTKKWCKIEHSVCRFSASIGVKYLFKSKPVFTSLKSVVFLQNSKTPS